MELGLQRRAGMRLCGWNSCVLLLLASAATTAACTAMDGSEMLGARASSPEEIAAAQEATADRKAAMAALLEGHRTDPAALAALLGEMPKGADLHSHLSGAVPTEKLVDWARAAALCLQTADFTLVEGNPCPEGTVSLATLDASAPLYGEIVEAWSMAGQILEPLDDVERRIELGDRHAHFFDAFLKFYPITRDSTAKMIAEVRRAAAAQRIAHVELQVAFGSSLAGRNAASIFAEEPGFAGWTEGGAPLDAWAAKAAAIRSKISKRLSPQIAELDRWEAEASALLSCDAADGTREAGCDVDVRYLVQLNRTQTREHVFGQLVYAMELAKADDAGADRIVGMNLALAEEDANSLRYYQDDMRSIATLRALARRDHPDEPPARIALHAGELVPELLAEDGSDDRHMTFHITDAVRYGGEAIADRIGHGTDIEREDPDGTLRAEMAARGVLVEACLTSNAWLLDVRGERHPLRGYLEAGVPVALATDDAGVFDITLTDELERAVEQNGVGYEALEQMARASVTHAFLPGESFEDDDACREALALERLEEAELPPSCGALVAQSPRARVRWTFERALLAFERAQIAP